jgi:hypothetical protein
MNKVKSPREGVEGERRDLRQPDIGDGHAEDGKGVAVAAQVLGEDFGDEDSDGAVEEDGVPGRVEEDEGNACRCAGRAAAVTEVTGHGGEESKKGRQGDGADVYEPSVAYRG